jgi:mRNA-degrading endonuclease toxin of MazEF toxin-antitoxin module
VVHPNWSLIGARGMDGRHHGRAVSADPFHQGTGLVVAVRITAEGGKPGGFELPVRAGKVSAAAIVSRRRPLDDQARDVQFEAVCDRAEVNEADRRIGMIFA